MKRTVGVTGADEAVLEGLSALLAELPGIEVVTPSQRWKRPPDVVVVDWGDAPLESTPEHLHALSTRYEGAEVVLLASAHPDDVGPSEWPNVRVLGSGASVIDLCRAVSARSPAPVTVRCTPRPGRRSSGALDGLTAQQRTIVDAVQGGLTDHQIGVALAISPSTVRSHLRGALRRLGLTARSELRDAEWSVLQRAPAYEAPTLTTNGQISAYLFAARSFWSESLAVALSCLPSVDDCLVVADDETAPPLSPGDVVLVDATDADRSSAGLLLAASTGARGLAVGPNDPELVRRLISRGADAYIVDGAPPCDFAEAMAAVQMGLMWISAEALRPLIAELVTAREGEDDAMRKLLLLTPRERDVLRILEDHKRDEQLATDLFVSPHTVHTHVQRLLQKLDVRTRDEAVELAKQHRFVERRLI